MDENMSKTVEQAAAFQKLWLDSFANMASVWSKFSPGSPPPEEMRNMRSGMLKVLGQTWDEFMRTPQFMEMMKASLNGALDLRRMSREGMNRVHEQFENPSKEDLDGVLLAIRHVERRVLERFEDLEERLEKSDDSVGKLDERVGRLLDRIDAIEEESERIGRESPSQSPSEPPSQSSSEPPRESPPKTRKRTSTKS